MPDPEDRYLDYVPSVGEQAMVVLNDSACTFCNEAFDIESGDAIALYRTHWYHESCSAESLRKMHEAIVESNKP